MSSSASNPTTTDSKPEGKLLAEWFWTDRWMGSSAFLLPIGPRGLYREMLTQAWRRGARLPNNHEAIRRATGCTIQEWNRCWPRIQHFWRVDGDYLVNDTQAEVYAEAQGVQQRAHDRGVKGAQARAQALAQAKLNQSLKDQPPSPSPSPSKIKKSSAVDPNDPNEEIASSFMEEYPALYARVRNGARYAVSRMNMDRDLEYARDLARGWPDLRRLLAMAEVFLRMDIGDKNRPGTLGQFLHMAPDADTQLRKNGR